MLQWGESVAGGGPYWAVGNWYIDDSGNAYCSPLLQVLPGQSLTGFIQLVQESGGLCKYTVGFIDYPQLSYTQGGVDPLIRAVEVLESYNSGDCTEYPATPSTPCLPSLSPLVVKRQPSTGTFRTTLPTAKKTQRSQARQSLKCITKCPA